MRGFSPGVCGESPAICDDERAQQQALSHLASAGNPQRFAMTSAPSSMPSIARDSPRCDVNASTGAHVSPAAC